MKKNIIYILSSLLVFIVLIIAIASYVKPKKQDNTLTKVKVAEVTHSIFYAPFYVAIENGYFEELGIDIDLILVSGSDNVAASVISKDTQVGLAGPESAIFVYEGNHRDYLQVFAGLTKRDGQFMLSRVNKEFDWNDLKGKEILIGRSTGMPAMNFHKALENQNINKEDVKINTSIEFGELAGAFIGGEGDYVNLFEPLASNLEKQGKGYVVTSVGSTSNDFPYTAFYARKSYLKENKQLMENFSKAIKKGLDYTLNNDGDIIAKVIKPQFKDTDVLDLVTMINRYKKADVWLKTPYIEEKFYNTLIDLLKENNLIKNNPQYKKLVVNLYE